MVSDIWVINQRLKKLYNLINVQFQELDEKGFMETFEMIQRLQMWRWQLMVYKSTIFIKQQSLQLEYFNVAIKKSRATINDFQDAIGFNLK